MKFKIKDANLTVPVVSRAFFLAWKACGGPLGMGILQNNPGATEKDIFDNVCTSGDYPGKNLRGNSASQNKGDIYGDYIFGRMVKTGIKWENDTISVNDSQPRHDYQAWSRKYKSYGELITEAAKELGTEAIHVK